MLHIQSLHLFRRDLRTRLPFRYGIATMTDVPHLFVDLDAEIHGAPAKGIAADHLPPKWFTKDPARDPLEEIDEMAAVIRQAAALAQGIVAATPFEAGRELYRRQDAWRREAGVPPLLAHFGTALVERALIDAFCRQQDIPFHRALREGLLGFDAAAFHPELQGIPLAGLLPESPCEQAILRHTVGLADPLEASDQSEPVNDGLPETLADCIRVYGLRHLKIKFTGPGDLDRLNRVLRLRRELMAQDSAFTLDGNECFSTVAGFREVWSQVEALPEWKAAAPGLLCVEQPFHRDEALRPETAATLHAWKDRPPIIIDESDAENDSVRIALAAGYAGASHKNCKGVFRGIANACLLAHRRRQGLPGLQTGEDLCNVGPVALLQDLAVQATLGILSVERNGHHYLRGLSFLPEEVQREMCRLHPDLYAWREAEGFATLVVHGGLLSLRSVNAAPFGVAPDLDVSQLGQSLS